MEGMGPVGRYHAKVRADHEAIVYRDTRLTWREVDELADRYARGLSAHGVRHGDRVGVLLMNCPEYLVLVQACMRLGAIFVPLNIRLTVPELTYILSDADCRVHITEHAFDEQAAGVSQELGIEWFHLEDTLSELCQDGGFTPPDVAWDDTLFLCYSSGTTGRPKGAMLSHGNVRGMVMGALAGHNFTAADRDLVIYPLAFTAGLVSSAMPIYTVGGTMVLDRVFEPRRCLDLLVRERITVFMAVPVIYAQMLALPEFEDADLSAMRVISSGGAVVPRDLIEAYQRKGLMMIQAYGLTEGGGLNIMLPPHDSLRKAGYVGVPAAWTEARVVDDDGREVAPNEVGELLLRGPDIMRGYWRNEAATEAALRDGWLHTGDLVECDPEGFIRIVERKDDMYISGGLNVYPAEIENAIAQIDGVVEAAVIGVPDGRWGQVGHAFVVSDDDRHLSAEEIREACRERLADYKIPRSVSFIDELPRGMSGKVLKKELRHAVPTEVQ